MLAGGICLRVFVYLPKPSFLVITAGLPEQVGTANNPNRLSAGTPISPAPILLSLLTGEKKKQEGLEETAAHIFKTERRSVASERDIFARYMAVCFSERIGERVDGRITNASRAGLFIRPHASTADGFAPVARLPGGYYRFEPSRLAMVGHSRGQAYRIGDTVRVAVAEANPLTGGLILDVLPGKP